MARTGAASGIARSNRGASYRTASEDAQGRTSPWTSVSGAPGVAAERRSCRPPGARSRSAARDGHRESGVQSPARLYSTGSRCRVIARHPPGDKTRQTGAAHARGRTRHARRPSHNTERCYATSRRLGCPHARLSDTWTSRARLERARIRTSPMPPAGRATPLLRSIALHDRVVGPAAADGFGPTSSSDQRQVRAAPPSARATCWSSRASRATLTRRSRRGRARAALFLRAAPG